jgi:hypothetical protein
VKTFFSGRPSSTIGQIQSKIKSTTIAFFAEFQKFSLFFSGNFGSFMQASSSGQITICVTCHSDFFQAHSESLDYRIPQGRPVVPGPYIMYLHLSEMEET